MQRYTLYEWKCQDNYYGVAGYLSYWAPHILEHKICVSVRILFGQKGIGFHKCSKISQGFILEYRQIYLNI